jgi:alanine racemase
MNTERSWTEINLDHFADNLRQLISFLPEKTSWMQIVKADAYGHGAYQIAKKAIALGASFLGVANVQEGMLLRYQGITAPILILSPMLESEVEFLFEYSLTPTIFSKEFANLINTIAKNKKETLVCHINVDTGMGRSGIEIKEAKAHISEILKCKHLLIEGIFSHYAASENDEEYSQNQKHQFKDLLHSLPTQFSYVHIANSSAVVTQPDNVSNLVRLGLLSFGVYSHSSLSSKIDLKPVMTFKTKISQLKYAEKGASIGYNRTFITSRKTKFAILPVGYADGYDFLLSNKGNVLCHKSLCPVIGKISMDMTAIDVTEIENVSVGDEVVLLGEGNKQIRAENISGLFGGSAYELLCQIGRRAKRYYFENRKIIDTSPLLRRDFVSHDYSDKKLSSIIETAIEQRLQSKEIAAIIYDDILSHLFKEKDKNIYYRSDFNHKISFKNCLEEPDYFVAETTLEFKKILQNDFFYIACAKNEKQLASYFLRSDVEYRWLLDDHFDLKDSSFHVTALSINNIMLEHSVKVRNDCIEIRCFHPDLAHLLGQEVHFSISTQTYYPKKSHQLTIYINEMTKGVEIEFAFENVLQNVEAVPLFSGRAKFPEVEDTRNAIRVFSQKNEWIMPNSGVVFAY